jgi:hypothetical protein
MPTTTPATQTPTPTPAPVKATRGADPYDAPAPPLRRPPGRKPKPFRLG